MERRSRLVEFKISQFTSNHAGCGQQDGKTMNTQIHNLIVSLIWGVADNYFRDVYVCGKYRDVILPTTVVQRLDAVLEETKDDMFKMKRCAKQQSSRFTTARRLKDLTDRAKRQKLKTDFVAYLDGFSPNVQINDPKFLSW
jgi:type I restriction enzyme M protein